VVPNVTIFRTIIVYLYISKRMVMTFA